MGIAGTAVRVYLMYVVGTALALGVVALVGQVLPDGIATFVGFALFVLLALAGAGWYALVGHG